MSETTSIGRTFKLNNLVIKGLIILKRLIASPSPQLPNQLGDGESFCEQMASFFIRQIDVIRAARARFEALHAADTPFVLLRPHLPVLLRPL